MRTKTILIALAALFTTFIRTVSAQEVLDGIAAVVNGEVITFSQVRELVAARERSLRDQYKGEELNKVVRELRLSALNELVDRQLILQEFKKMQEKGAKLPNYVIEDRMQQIVREEFGGDRQAFIRTLEAQGYTIAKFKEVEREKFIVQAVRSAAVRSEVVVAPGEIEKYYNDNKTGWAAPEQIKLRMIVLRKETNEGGGKKKMAEEILQKVRDGAAFEQMAQMYSEDSSRDVGGDWGWIDRKTLNERLTMIAFNLPAGKPSQIIELEGNYYILYCEARKNAKVKPLDEMRDDIRKKLEQEKRTQQQTKWLEGLRKKAYIKTF
jgi:parvulin-like peptidyl-prolyl isomerase